MLKTADSSYSFGVTVVGVHVFLQGILGNDLFLLPSLQRLRGDKEEKGKNSGKTTFLIPFHSGAVVALSRRNA